MKEKSDIFYHFTVLYRMKTKFFDCNDNWTDLITVSKIHCAVDFSPAIFYQLHSFQLRYLCSLNSNPKRKLKKSFQNKFSERHITTLNESNLAFFRSLHHNKPCVYHQSHRDALILASGYSFRWYKFDIFCLIWRETIWPNLIFLSRLPFVFL